MAVDPRKRQKQLEKKAAKRRTVQTTKKTSIAGGVGASANQLAVTWNSPIHECLVPAGLFEIGIGNVVFSRKLPSGDVGASFFLLDVYCLGVKSAHFQVMPQTKYLSIVERLDGGEHFESVDPPYARKLVEDTAAYASELGFQPHPDYHLARKIFGDIDPASCPIDFTFGKDGMPFFVSGPNDTPTKCRRIVDTLSKRLGPDGYHYIVEVGKEEFNEL